MDLIDEFYLCVDKPWGCFDQYTHNQQTTVKILTVEPFKKLSLQSHKKRAELWIPLTNRVVVWLDDIIFEPQLGERVFIPLGSKHRLESKELKIKVLEISYGEFDEDDIIRHEDDFNRI